MKVSADDNAIHVLFCFQFHFLLVDFYCTGAKTGTKVHHTGF